FLAEFETSRLLEPFAVDGDRGEMVVARSKPFVVDQATKLYTRDFYLTRRDPQLNLEKVNSEPIRFVTEQPGLWKAPGVRRLTDGKFVAAGFEDNPDRKHIYFRYYPPFAHEPSGPVVLHTESLWNAGFVGVREVMGRVF